MLKSMSEMQVIALSGDAKTKFLNAIALAKEKKFDLSNIEYQKAIVQLSKALRLNKNIDNKEVTMVVLHAQNHLMSAVLLKDVSFEIIDILERFYG